MSGASDDMVERVASALAASDGLNNWDGMRDERRVGYRLYARVAIEAMQPPFRSMTERELKELPYQSVSAPLRTISPYQGGDTVQEEPYPPRRFFAT